jgi:hypothetical protein
MHERKDKMRIERAKQILAKVEIEMNKWADAMKKARTVEDREMFHGLYKVKSQAARRIEEAIDYAS